MSNLATRVFILSIDALNPAHLPFYGYNRDTAPFLSDLADRNTVFANCYSVSSHTREAMPTMLTGEYPLKAVNSRYELDVNTVAETFQGPTAMFHSNPFISRAYGFDRGFDYFDDDLRLGQNKLLTLGKRLLDKLRNRHYACAEKINQRSLDWLADQDVGRLLCWNHYMDVHGPYQPPGEYRTFFADRNVSNRRSQYLLQRGIRSPESLSDEARQTLVDLYDGEIRYVDDQIQSFFEALRERGLYEDSLVVLTADHGEGLGTEGFYEHPRRLTEGLLHVPLVLAGPDVPSQRIEQPVSLRNLPSTVLGAVNSPDPLPGVDLSEALTDPTAVPDEPIFAQVSKKHSSEVSFYARTPESVAGATLDRDDDSTSFKGGDPALAALRSHVGTFASETEGRDDDGPEDTEIERRLRALGYLNDE